VPVGAAQSCGEALVLVRRQFAQAGISSPELDARILLQEAAEIDAAELARHPDRPLGKVAAERLSQFVARRLGREPVARILGVREFWGLPFRLSAATLEPRPDTETVVEAALASLVDRRASLQILDLGTGTGCLLVALLHELPASSGLGIDRSLEAAKTARRNARLNGVEGRAAFAVGDWAAAVAGRFDLVVANPPYIATRELADLQPEVRLHDPPAALDGGPDGLSAYRAILAAAPRLLKRGGSLVVEIGVDQEAAVTGLARQAGVRIERSVKDLGDRPRAMLMKRTSVDTPRSAPS
jgi:release factor glutamine methyltransferase